MKRLIFAGLASLLLLLGACTQRFQETPEIGVPTIVNGDEGVVVVPTQIVDGGDVTPESANTPAATLESSQPAATATTEPENAGNGESDDQPAACQPRTDWIAYTVDTGDTLGRIAQRTNSTINELAQANCLTNVNNLIVGDTLYVPNAPTAENPDDDFVRINFPAGEDSVRLTGELAENEVHDYVFTAQKGQFLFVGFGEWTGARVWVESFNGEQLAQGIGEHAGYVLPETGDYLLKVTGDWAISYELSVYIPADFTANTPERVQFASGATSAVVDGQSNASIPQYVVAASEGQQLSLAFTQGSFQVAVRGANGQRLFDFNDAQPYHSYGPIILPATQDYVISVLAVGSESYAIDVPYELTITIVDEDETPIDPVAEAERISFAAGQISAKVNGVGSETLDQYVLRASAGQRLMVAFMPITDQNQERYISVYGEDGQVLSRFQSNVTVILPETQDYFINVHDVVGHPYELMVVVDPNEVAGDTERVQFAAGVVSAELTGTLNVGDTKRFVLQAQAGQSLGLINQTAVGAAFIPVIVTPNGELLQPYNVNNMVTSELLTLPATGEYTILLLAVSNDSGAAVATYNYELRITTP